LSVPPGDDADSNQRVGRPYMVAIGTALAAAIAIQAFNIHVLRETIDLVAAPPPGITASGTCHKTRPSALATRYLGALRGVEIGASQQNSFDLPTAINVDYVPAPNNQPEGCPYAVVHLVASGDALPFKDSTLDYVLSSHVIEHFFDPMKALKEWDRVIRPGGYIFLIVPHRDRTFDRHREATPLAELIDRHSGKIRLTDYAKPLSDQALVPFGKANLGDYRHVMPHLLAPRSRNIKLEKDWQYLEAFDDHHWTVWRTADFVEMVRHMKMDIVEMQDVDDKVGNGFTIVIRKKPAAK
jgi:ubiquinone/menaquinone biosynthesis C-methylase UbiE